MSCPTETVSTKYAKRPGTSGIRGHLYETKLLSLIYFRAIHDDSIEEFHLATNVDDIGAFDDICFRVKWKDLDKPVVVFVQVKHRENNYHLLRWNQINWLKYYKSYLKIKHKFDPNNKDVLFKGTFSETECRFVIFTTGTVKFEEKESEVKEYLDLKVTNLIGTTIEGYSSVKDDIDEFPCLSVSMILEVHMTALAQSMAKCILGELNDIQMLMQNEYVIRYHVILAQKVLDVSESQTEGHRIARFRHDFFYINEEYLELFKDELCTEILKRRKIVDRKDFNVLSSLHKITDVEELYKICRGFITYRNGLFDCLDKIFPGSASVLGKINRSPENIRKTVEFAVKECLPSLEFKVPASFGNKDLLIRGDERKIERRLNYLTTEIVKLTKRSNNKSSNDCILIDTSLKEGFLQHNGGIASAVGNLLISSGSNHFKFNRRYKSLGPLARRLFDKLQSELNNSIFNYRFEITVEIFPKLDFDLNRFAENKNYGPDLEMDFFGKLLLCTFQCTEQKMGETLIYEIKNESQSDVRINPYVTFTFGVNSDAIFLQLHDAVQKWWMSSGEAPYLTKEGSLYEQAVKLASDQLLTCDILNMIYLNKINNYSLSEDAVNSIKFDELPSGTIIVSDNSALTVAKFTKHLNKYCVVLDLDYVLNLSTKDGETLRSELTKMDKVHSAIVIFDKLLITASTKKKIENIANFLQEKKVIIITDQNSVKITRQYFSKTNNEIKDERNNLNDMNKESLNNFLENTKLMFQCNEVYLDQILEDESINYIGGGLLHKLMHSDKNIIGRPVSYSNDITESYVERTVMKHNEVTRRFPANEIRIEEKISSLYDLEENVVLIIGVPGMGKSTLLTHLSLKTKEMDPTIWILRINLLEHSRQFNEWQEDKTDIDILECSKFLCQVAISEERRKQDDVLITLEECNGTVQLKNCTADDWTVFQLRLFLLYLNKKSIIILFDGFDEICPTYAHEVLTLIKVVANSPRRYKMWITSRSFDKIITILELQFRTLYKLKPLEEEEQRYYLNDRTFRMKLDLLPGPSVTDNETKKKNPLSRTNDDDLRIVDLLNTVSSNIPSLHFNEFVATPLHLNMIADYLCNQLTSKKRKPNKPNIFDIYESFLETKLKRIRFQEKNKSDMSKPDNVSLYKRVHADTMDKHKKLAAYAIYDKCLFDDDELKQCKEMINELKEGEERTGIICNVVNDIPIFVHSTFAEYFAVEHICDLLKSKRKPKSIWNFILNVVFFKNINVLVLLDAKLKVDEELTKIVGQHKQIIFELLLEQSENTKSMFGDIKSSLCEAIRHDLRHLGSLLLSTVKFNLEHQNSMNFINIVKETNMLMVAVKMEFEDVVVTIVDSLRIIDESKLSALFENIESSEFHNKDLKVLTTDELVQKLHTHVWTQMDIVPEWENLAEFSGQIYFI